MRTRAATLLALLLAFAAACALAACGGEESATAGKSADEIVAAAAEAADEARGVHLVNRSGEAEIDVVLVDGIGARGTVELRGERLELVAIGADYYTKSAGKPWLKIPPDSRGFGSFVAIANKDLLLQQLFASLEGAEKDGVEQLAGAEAVVLRSDGMRFWIAADGEPYLLKATGEGVAGPAELRFSDWDETVELRAPADAIDVENGDTLDD